MRVVQVVPQYPPRTGGVETHVAEVSERLVERGHDVTVVTADADGLTTSAESRGGVHVVRNPGFSPGGAFHIAPGIIRSVRGLDADVVHAHNYHALPVLFAAIGASNTPFVVTPHYHGGSASAIRDRLLDAYRPFGARALRSADAVVAVSEWEQGELRADFDVDATVIPNGIDVERFRNATPVERDRPYLLTVGRLEAYKGVQDVIRALPELPSFDLVVAGDGPYRDELERVADREGVRERVEFRGYVPDDDLPGLYAGAVVYLLLSRFEAYGITVGEALAAGTPCVVRPAGALVNWESSDGCVLLSNGIPDAVNVARSRTTDPSSLPTWDDAVDSLTDVYGSVESVSDDRPEGHV